MVMHTALDDITPLRSNIICGLFKPVGNTRKMFCLGILDLWDTCLLPMIVHIYFKFATIIFSKKHCSNTTTSRNLDNILNYYDIFFFNNVTSEYVIIIQIQWSFYSKIVWGHAFLNINCRVMRYLTI